MVSKTALFLISIVFIHALGFRWWTVGIFLVSALWAYASSSIERKAFRASFLMLLVTSLLIIQRLGTWNFPALWEVLIIVGMGILYFLFIGLLDLLFQNRKSVYEAGTTLLVFFATLSMAHLTAPETMWAFTLVLIVFISLLIREHVKIEGTSRKKSIMIGITSALIMGELAWIVSFLPLHILSFTALIVLIYLMLKTVLGAYREGRLDVRNSLTQALIFVSIILIILGTGMWSM